MIIYYLIVQSVPSLNVLFHSQMVHLNSIFQLPQALESHVAVDINYCAAVIMEYTDHVNILACFQGSPMNHSRMKTRTNSIFFCLFEWKTVPA